MMSEKTSGGNVELTTFRRSVEQFVRSPRGACGSGRRIPVSVWRPRIGGCLVGNVYPRRELRHCARPPGARGRGRVAAMPRTVLAGRVRSPSVPHHCIVPKSNPLSLASAVKPSRTSCGASNGNALREAHCRPSRRAAREGHCRLCIARVRGASRPCTGSGRALRSIARPHRGSIGASTLGSAHWCVSRTSRFLQPSVSFEVCAGRLQRDTCRRTLSARSAASGPRRAVPCRVVPRGPRSRRPLPPPLTRSTLPRAPSCTRPARSRSVRARTLSCRHYPNT
jgi:hypothetical protein